MRRLTNRQRIWRTILLGWASAMVGGAYGQSPELTAPPEPEGMHSLFNGKDLSGWEGDPRLWSVVDGALHGETTAEKSTQGNTFLIWQDGVLGDFELRLAFRCNATNNSGIQYRSERVDTKSDSNRWVVAGYQHEIRNEMDLPNVAGFIYDERGKRGRLCLVGERAVWKAGGEKQVTETILSPEGFRKLFRLDDWNDVVIIGQGNRLRHYLNGHLVVDFTDDDPQLARREGVLALQLHAGAPMWVEFKELRWKEHTRDGAR